MHNAGNINVIWWITAVELPAMAGLFWLNWRTRQDSQDDIEDTRIEGEKGISNLRDKLSSYKLEVAKSYASIAYLKEVERRLTKHLLRIENKLDKGIHLNSGGRS